MKSVLIEQPQKSGQHLLVLESREDPKTPVLFEINQLEPGEILLVYFRFESPAFYDIWAKRSDLEWCAEPIGLNEWLIWVYCKGNTPPRV